MTLVIRTLNIMMKRILPIPFILALLIWAGGCKPELPFNNIPPNTNPHYYNRPEYARLDSAIRNRLKENNTWGVHIPGLSVAVVRDGKLDFLEGYGLLQMSDTNRKVNSESKFMLGELTQPIIATAIMQLHEKGQINADADINWVLPAEMQVKNPFFPTFPITPRMLISHTSTLLDEQPFMQSLYTVGDSPDRLKDFLFDYFQTNPAGHYVNDKPGKYYQVQKINLALAAYIIEAATQMSINEYAKVHIYSKLGSFHGSFYMAELDAKQVATPHTNNFLPLNPLVELDQYGYSYYPAGTLRTSAEHLSRFLIAASGNGKYGQQTLLNDSTVRNMRKVAYPLASNIEATGWRYRLFNGRTLLGLNGSDQGVSNRMYYDTLSRTGVILLTNGDGYDAQLDTIMERAFRAAGI